MITFERCKNGTDSAITCKSDKEINDWLVGKYILTLSNQKKFVQHKFEDERTLRTSETKWHALAADTRIDYVYQITRTEQELNDNLSNTGRLFIENESGFYVSSVPNRVMAYIEPYQNSITFEMSLHYKRYSRRVYSWLDFASDLGGLAGAIRLICLFFLSIVTFNSSFQYLMAQLYVTRIK